MQKKAKLFFMILSATLLSVSLSANISSKSVTLDAGANEMSSPSQKYTTSKDTFYSSANLTGKKGTDLQNSLATLMYSKHKYYTTYDDIRGANAYSDADPNDPTKLIAFYGGISIDNAWNGAAVWNREHVWCQSLSNGLYGTTGAGADIHQLKPSIKNLNSLRNNRAYAEVKDLKNVTVVEVTYNNNKTGNYYVKDDTVKTTTYNTKENGRFEPRNAIKGDVARILMYIYTHYAKSVTNNASNAKAGNLSITDIVYTPERTAQSAWNLLIKWSNLDPVDSFEINRNEYCASITGTRNPYIDHPEFATIAFDNTYTGAGAFNDQGSTTYNVNYYLNDGTNNTYLQTTVTAGNAIEQPTNPTRNGYTFVGWYIDSTTTSSYNFSTLVSTDISLYAKWIESTTGSGTGYWKQVTSNSDLSINSKYIIVAKDAAFAMNTTNDGTRYKQAAITKGEGRIDSISNEVQTLTLLQGYLANTYSFLVNSDVGGYLQLDKASNRLVTSSSKGTANTSMTITINSDKSAIINSCAYTDYNINYNSSYGYFAFYKSQSPITLYKYIDGNNESTSSFSVSSLKSKIAFDIYSYDNVIYAIENKKVTLTATFESKNATGAKYYINYQINGNEATYSEEITPTSSQLSYTFLVDDYNDTYMFYFSMVIGGTGYTSDTKEFTFKYLANSYISTTSDEQIINVIEFMYE